MWHINHPINTVDMKVSTTNSKTAKTSSKQDDGDGVKLFLVQEQWHCRRPIEHHN
jgi:hypothetical protein